MRLIKLIVINYEHETIDQWVNLTRGKIESIPARCQAAGLRFAMLIFFFVVFLRFNVAGVSGKTHNI